VGGGGKGREGDGGHACVIITNTRVLVCTYNIRRYEALYTTKPRARTGVGGGRRRRNETAYQTRGRPGILMIYRRYAPSSFLPAAAVAAALLKIIIIIIIMKTKNDMPLRRRVMLRHDDFVHLYTIRFYMCIIVDFVVFATTKRKNNSSIFIYTHTMSLGEIVQLQLR